MVTSEQLKSHLSPYAYEVEREEESDEDEVAFTESLQYNFNTIRVATNEFADSNKLGQGGFGAVYKVRLHF